LTSLRGNFAAFPGAVSKQDLKRLREYTDDAGIQPFLLHRLKETGALATCPSSLRQAFERRSLMEVVVHNLRKKELQRIIVAFHEANIRALIMKGAALSYLIYPEPNLRTCWDIDLFVDPKKTAAADVVIRSLGYELDDRFNFEINYVKEDRGVEHLLDLHWKLSNSQFFSGKFGFEEIYERSIPIQALSPHARALEPIDSFINACMHMAHHRMWDRLIWLTDIYLLHGRLSAEQIQMFVSRTIEKKCGAVCLEALRMTREVYGIELNHPAIKLLIEQESSGFRKSEPSDYLLDTDRDYVYEFFHLMLESSWGDRFRLLRRALFPPLSELTGRYDTGSRIKILRIYLYRIMIKLPTILILGRKEKRAL
ncbi:MAG: nucleotidyltransferase family protein, partial [Acidobacteria bacterium]|nr:nucleotidyltransferase family protein [Acidobacteriota bacterium]